MASTKKHRPKAVSRRKRQYNTTRVYLGEMYTEWERQKSTCGGSNAEFLKHLLASHSRSCANFHITSPEMRHREEGESDGIDDDVPHETPTAQACTSADNKFAPLRPKLIVETSAVSGNGPGKPERGSESNMSENDVNNSHNLNPDLAGDESELDSDPTSSENIKSTPLRSERRRNQKKTKLKKQKKVKVEVSEKVRDNISNGNNSHLPCNEVKVGIERLDQEQLVPDFVEKNENTHACSEKVSDHTSCEPHTNTCKRKRRLICNICKVAFASLSEKNAHKAVHTNIRKETQLECKICSAVFSSEISLKNHHRVHANEQKSAEVKNSEKCPHCFFFGTRATSLKRHMLLKHNVDLGSNPKAHVCEHCNRGYNSKMSLRKHLVKIHNMSDLGPDLVCEQCGERFFCTWELREHTKYHKERDITCTYDGCSFKLRSQSELNDHITKIHIRGRSYKCPYEGCEWSFYRSNALRSHINSIHLQIRKHKCEWPGCDKVFKSQKNLAVHERIHKGQKPIKCDHCDFHCRQRTSLVYHLRKHGIILESKDKRGKHWVPSSNTVEMEDISVAEAIPRTGSFNTIKVQRTLKSPISEQSNKNCVSPEVPSTYTDAVPPNSWNTDCTSTEQLQNQMHTQQSTIIDTFIDKIFDNFKDKKPM